METITILRETFDDLKADTIQLAKCQGIASAINRGYEENKDDNDMLRFYLQELLEGLK